MRYSSKVIKTISAAALLSSVFAGAAHVLAHSSARHAVGPSSEFRHGFAGHTVQGVAGQETARLVREIRHELLTLPWYGVFDWLEGNVAPDGTVTLRGWVVRPTTKSSAEARVKEIEGVSRLKSEIKVLPLSPNDDRLRRAIYLTLFGGDSPLFRYALGANPSIHIIVENGRAILKGVVSSEADRNLAGIKAKGVPGLFEVRNELVVEED